MATVDTNIDLIASILNPASTQLREEQLRVSEQNRRVQQAESRRADRDQQLQEILAPLQSRRLSQELQLNTLKLEEADRVAQTRIADEGARAELMELFSQSALSNFDNEVVAGNLEKMKRHSRVLSDPKSSLFGLDQTLIGETIKARQKEADIDKALEIAELRAGGQTPLREDRLIERADELDAEAARAAKAGDAVKFQRLKKQANDFRAKAGPSRSSIRVTQPGGATIEVNQGAGEAATTAFQTDIQKRQMVMELGTEAANELLSRIRPEDVGVAGWVGGNVYPFVRQINPNVGDMQVIPNRMALGEFGELLKSGLSAEDVSRLTEGDVKRLHRIGTDLLDAKLDHGTIVARIQEAKSIFKRRSRAYAERTGQPIPDAHKEKDEVKADYDNTVAAAQRQLQANEITAEQHDAAVTQAYRRLQESMRRFHNTIVTGQ